MQYTSELDNSSISLIKEPVNLKEFLEQKVINYMLQARSENILVTLEIQNKISALVILDINKLERILDSIVSNGLQYTPANGKISILVKS